MSFLDDLMGGAGGFLSGLGGSLAKTAILGYALNKMNKNVNPTNVQPTTTIEYIPDAQTRLQNNSDPDNKIPVVYGQASLGGIITDSALVNNDKVMYFCFAISEKTGTKLSDSQASSFQFLNIYWDDCLLTFQSDGTTVASKTDRDGNADTSIAGLISVYCFAGNSTTPVTPNGYSNNSLNYAYNIFPGWQITHIMNDLIFAIVRVDYDASKNLTKLGNVKFHIANTMTQPGDCIYDYMTNTRYGASLLPSEIYTA